MQSVNVVAEGCVGSRVLGPGAVLSLFPQKFSEQSDQASRPWLK